MAYLEQIAAQAELDAYKAYVAWLAEAQRVRKLFVEADLSLPVALGRLFENFRYTKKKKRVVRKRITK